MFAGFLVGVLVLENSLREYDASVCTQVRLVELDSLDKLASVTLIPALVCTLVLAVLTIRARGNDRWLVVGSFGLLALVLVTTLVINLPINGDQADWSVQSPPSDWASVREGCPRGTYCLCRIGVRCADRCRGQPYDSV